ncbi:hypothetical protein BH24PSE2_BH24PSE2_00010 [soil metagenome]
MSRWDRWGWYPPAPKKKPPPARGIRMKKTGSTWWGRRWVEALEGMSREYSNRLARGRTYARAGRTHDLDIKAGKVTAKVTGSRARPYKVRISLAKLPDAVWTRAIAAMAGQARFAAELLAGQMPQDIDAAFKEAHASVFPAKAADLDTECSCPDWANPCKHVAATHYVLGEALDRDPFLLFELRGRTREQVLAALRAARADKVEPHSNTRSSRKKTQARDETVPSVSLGRVRNADYDKLREPLPALHLNFDTPAVPGAVLRQLGIPAAWSMDIPPAEMFAPMLRAAADEARRLALAEPVEEPHAIDSERAEARTQAKAQAKKKAAKSAAGKAAARVTKSSKATSASKARIISKASARTGKTKAERASARPSGQRQLKLSGNDN